MLFYLLLEPCVQASALTFAFLLYNYKFLILYQKFFCGGRLIFGPDASSVVLSASLVGIPALLFCIKMFLNLPKTSPAYGYSVLILGIVLSVLVGYNMFQKL